MRNCVNAGEHASVKTLIKEKMIVLDDFNICSKDDETMIERLEKEITSHSNKSPRDVLDCYCRPIIQEKVRSWL